MNVATSPTECWRIYEEEQQARLHGAITRTLKLVTGYTYQNLRRLLLAYSFSENGAWVPTLHATGESEYICVLPNDALAYVKRRYYIKGVITGTWWHLHWPTELDPVDPRGVINLVHQIDTLKEARALIAEYVANDYTVPEGACTL